MSSLNLQIRRAGPADAEIVALLGRITFTETFGNLFERYPDDLHEYLDCTFGVAKIRRSLEQARNAYWLAIADGLPVGYAKLKTPSPTHLLSGEDVAQLQKIYVLREFLGQGIGKPLFQAILSHTMSRPVGVLWLDVLKENERAIRFYEGFGFTAFGEDAYAIGAPTFLFHLMVLRIPSKAT